MDYTKEIFPLNHFVLWAKGWYHKVHNTGDVNKDLEDTMKSIFALDDYCGRIMKSVDFAAILLNQFEDYNNWSRENGFHFWRLTHLIDEMRSYQRLGYSEDNSIIMALRSYLQTKSVKEIKLKKPVFSRELYKKYDLIKGQLLGTPKQGTTYKQMNKETEKFNW